LCGFRPTGKLHLGHYFSVIKPGQQGVDVLVANYHAPEEKNLETSLNFLRGFGVLNIRLQKDVFNPDLYFKLLSLAKMGDLTRMTQYQSANVDTKTGQLLTYPVLMAHDVAGYSEIIVGEDQEQHLNYARKLLRKYNSVYKTNFPIPVANIVVGRIKDLQKSLRKMSKTFPKGCLFLDDYPDDIRKKIRSATADEAGLENLKFLYGEFVGGEIPTSNLELKEKLSEALIDLVNKPRYDALEEMVRLDQEMGLYG
jgi:tryptophanyl-tRNA synthetase